MWTACTADQSPAVTNQNVEVDSRYDRATGLRRLVGQGQAEPVQDSDEGGSQLLRAKVGHAESRGRQRRSEA